MENLTKTISRSFTRKLNLGNYESADFWSSYSEVVSADTDPESMQRISALLYGFAKTDVEQAILDYKREQFKELPKDKVNPKDSYALGSEVYE